MRPSAALLAAALLATASPAWAALDGFELVSPGIYRGSQPTTTADFDRLRHTGIRTILTLRTSRAAIEREVRVALAFGMRTISIPVHAAGVPPDAAVNRALAVLVDPTLQPVFVHCQLGEDRTGLIVGLHRVLHESWPPRRAYDEMQRRGFNQYLVGLEWYFWRRIREVAAREPAR